MDKKPRFRKPILLRLPTGDNFKEWYNYYGPMLNSYYQDFTLLFENEEPPDFMTFMEYCYNNTRSTYNSIKNRHECKIYNDY